MIDLGAIEGFDWDDGNTRKNLDKPRVTQAEAELVFSSDVLLAQDVNHSHDEPRYQALGSTAHGRLLHITFTLRYESKKIRVISARDMHRKERAYYEQEP